MIDIQTLAVRIQAAMVQAGLEIGDDETLPLSHLALIAAVVAVEELLPIPAG